MIDKFQQDECEQQYSIIYKICNDVMSKRLLQIENGIDNYYDCIVVGLDYNDMKANETRLQFESRIKDELDRAFPGRNNKVNCHVDGGYEG